MIQWPQMPSLINSPFCVYCGQKATTFDHFIPLRKLLEEDRNFTLPACQPCNSTAGGHFFETFDDKANFVLTHRMKRSAPINWSILIKHASLVSLAIRLHQVNPKREVIQRTSSENWRLRRIHGKHKYPRSGNHQVSVTFAMKLARQAILDKLHQTSGKPTQ